jgi:hypothetical protein
LLELHFGELNIHVIVVLGSHGRSDRPGDATISLWGEETSASVTVIVHIDSRSRVQNNHIPDHLVDPQPAVFLVHQPTTPLLQISQTTEAHNQVNNANPLPLSSSGRVAELAAYQSNDTSNGPRGIR